MGWLEHTVIPDINWQRDRHWSRWGNIRVASVDVRFGSKADIEVEVVAVGTAAHITRASLARLAKVHSRPRSLVASRPIVLIDPPKPAYGQCRCSLPQNPALLV